jgi:peptidoglycan/LPS O-acetylase OafA/YrhL
MAQSGYANGASDLFSALLTLLFALFSWYAVELPAQRFKKKFSG